MKIIHINIILLYLYAKKNIYSFILFYYIIYYLFISTSKWCDYNYMNELFILNDF